MATERRSLGGLARIGRGGAGGGAPAVVRLAGIVELAPSGHTYHMSGYILGDDLKVLVDSTEIIFLFKYPDYTADPGLILPAIVPSDGSGTGTDRDYSGNPEAVVPVIQLTVPSGFQDSSDTLRWYCLFGMFGLRVELDP